MAQLQSEVAAMVFVLHKKTLTRVL